MSRTRCLTLHRRSEYRQAALQPKVIDLIETYAMPMRKPADCISSLLTNVV